MNGLGICLGAIAPYYNLVLVMIVALLFYKLFNTPTKKVFVKPWKFLFVAIFIYVIEEFLTVAEGINLILFPTWLFPFFEMIMIILFIYMLLIQREYIKGTKK